MNVVASSGPRHRLAISPFARRLALERDISLDDLAGSGPNGRIIAADIPEYRMPAKAEMPVEPALAPALSTFTFSAVASLVDLYKLAVEAERVGLMIDVEDAVHRAARAALSATDGRGDKNAEGIALEADGRQILISTEGGLSIGIERKLRLAAQTSGVDVSQEAAFLSLRVIHASRIFPVSMPLLRERKLRLVVVVDKAGEQASALLCANASEITETYAVQMLEAFVTALEKPLALMA